MKVSNDQLSLWCAEGISQAEMARRASVSRGCISQRLAKLNLAASRGSLIKHGEALADHRINTLQQLEKVNQAANELLDTMMKFHRGDEGSIQLLEGQLRKFKVGKKGTEKEFEEVKMTDPRMLALKAMQEIREQLSLQNEIFKSIFDVRAAMEFESEVLAAIERVAPDVRSEIVNILQKKHALRSLVQPLI
jgi:DNA-binding transcriptional regulator YiaG